MSRHQAPAPGPRVRGAAAADAAAIGEVHAEAWRAAYAEVFGPGALALAVARRRGTGRTLTAQLVADHEPRLRDGSTLLVVVADDRVVGFTHGGPGPADAPAPEVHACYVHPRWWGTGAAQVLWEATLAALPAPAGTPRVLWTLEGAGRARAFYERQGWAPTGRRREHDLGTGQAVTVVEYREP